MIYSVPDANFIILDLRDRASVAFPLRIFKETDLQRIVHNESVLLYMGNKGKFWDIKDGMMHCQTNSSNVPGILSVPMYINRMTICVS